MSQLNVGQGIISSQLRLPQYNGESNYPTGLGTSDAGVCVFDTSAKQIAFWDGTEWRRTISVGQEDGLTAGTPIINFANWALTNPSSGQYWVAPSQGVAAQQVYVDTNGSGSFTGITSSGIWVQIRYDRSYYSRSDAWRGQSGLTNPANESSTAFSGLFGFEQDSSWIAGMLGISLEVRQVFESWGYGSVGWTYQGSNAYMEGRGFDGVNYTRWGGNGGTHTGVTGGRLSGMSHSTTSINGPWNNPTSNQTDQTDRNDSTWRYGRFYFRWTGGTAKRPLPIIGVYNADVDGSSEQRYFPFRDSAGGWSGQGESNTYIKVA